MVDSDMESYKRILKALHELTTTCGSTVTQIRMTTNYFFTFITNHAKELRHITDDIKATKGGTRIQYVTNYTLAHDFPSSPKHFGIICFVFARHALELRLALFASFVFEQLFGRRRTAVFLLVACLFFWSLSSRGLSCTRKHLHLVQTKTTLA